MPEAKSAGRVVSWATTLDPAFPFVREDERFTADAGGGRPNSHAPPAESQSGVKPPQSKGWRHDPPHFVVKAEQVSGRRPGLLACGHNLSFGLTIVRRSLFSA